MLFTIKSHYGLLTEKALAKNTFYKMFLIKLFFKKFKSVFKILLIFLF
jgi:hypothetical protein